MSRTTTLLLILALLLCSAQSHATRLMVDATTTIKHKNKGGAETVETEEGCEGNIYIQEIQSQDALYQYGVMLRSISTWYVRLIKQTPELSRSNQNDLKLL
ncbi:hypothetical protein Tco_0462983 [Tanacetum coccineum]